jgi:hypothetical protein
MSREGIKRALCGEKASVVVLKMTKRVGGKE